MVFGPRSFSMSGSLTTRTGLFWLLGGFVTLVLVFEGLETS